MKILGTQDSNTQTTNTGAQTSSESLTFIKKRHEKFLLRFLDILPGDRFASLETSRMTILFFAISGLDVLGSLETSISEERKKEIIEWIYSLQVETGFLGSTFLKIPALEQPLCDSVHIAMTYTALATLVILGNLCRYCCIKMRLSSQKNIRFSKNTYVHNCNLITIKRQKWMFAEGAYT